MQTTVARSCVAYGTSSSTTPGPVFNAADRGRRGNQEANR